MVLSTSEKLASQNPAVRREGQRELSQQTSSQAVTTVSKARNITQRGYTGTTTSETVATETKQVVAAQEIPKQYWGTSSAEYGQVSPTGKVEHTPEQVARGQGGAKVSERRKLPEVIKPTGTYEPARKLTWRERIEKVRLESLTRRKTQLVSYDPLGSAYSFPSYFKKTTVEVAEGYVAGGKSLIKGFPKEYVDVMGYGEKKGAPFTDIFKGTFVEPTLKKLQWKKLAEYEPEKPILLKVAEGIKPTAKFVYDEPKLSAAIGLSVVGSVGREMLRRPLKTTLEFAFFAGLGNIPRVLKAAQVLKETAVLRSKYSLRTGKVQLGEIKPTVTPTYKYEPTKGEFVFGSQGEIVGRQTQLSGLGYSKSAVTSTQAELMPGKLAVEKAAKGQDQYLGKWLPRPLSPKEVATVQRFEGNVLVDKVKYQSEFVPQYKGEYLGGRLSFKPELKSPEEVFLPTTTEKFKAFITEPFRKKKGELQIPELIKGDIFEKFSGEYYLKPPKPQVTKPLQTLKPVAGELSEVRLGSVSLLKTPQKQEISLQLQPIQNLKQDIKPTIALDQTIKQIQTPIQKPIQEPKIIQRTRPKQKQKLITLPELKITEITKPTSTTKPKIPIKITPPVKRIPPKKIPIRTLRISFPKMKFKSKESFAPGYSVFVKRKGKIIKISKGPLLKAGALSLGARVVEKTPAATFYVKKAGSILKTRQKHDSYFSDRSFRFRMTGGEDFLKGVEKEKYRISTPGELRGITFKGIMAGRKSKSKKNDLFKEMFGGEKSGFAI